MRILGYIVSKNKIKNILPNIQVVPSISLIEDKNKPILIVGLEEAKKNASSFSILEKKLDEKLFWTFGKREKRSDHETDIEKFQDFVLKESLCGVKYYYFNVLKVNFGTLKRLISIINNQEEKYFYADKKIIYMYYDNFILGVSLDIIDYLGLKRKKILDLIRKTPTNKIFYNDFILPYKIKKNIAGKNYATPFFLSLMA